MKNNSGEFYRCLTVNGFLHWSFFPNKLTLMTDCLKMDIELAHMLTQAHRLLGVLEGTVRNLPDIEPFLHMILLNEARNSCAFDGIMADMESILIFSKQTADGIMVKNYCDTLQKLKKEPFSLNVLCKIHKNSAEMNVVKDVIFEGNVLKMITDSIAYLSTQIKEKTYLGKDGLFVTEEEYPKFVWQEIIVNAVTHRAYSISGTDIQIKMFDNRIVVESPGKLPGLVRADNIRHTHFSRNPKIAEFLRAFDFVKEYGEGVDRMCQEMEAKGLQGPEYCTNVFLLQAVIYNSAFEKETDLSDNLAFEAENSAIQNKKLAFGYQKTAFGNKKLAIETLNSIIEVQHYNEPTKANIILVYNMIEANQVFGAPEVKDILKCSASSSKDIMKKLRDMEVVVTVKGKGKGKYRFVYDKEMKQ